MFVRSRRSIGIRHPLLVAMVALLQLGAVTRLATWSVARDLGGCAVDMDFPCAGHDCGCTTAEDCRTDCCCLPTARPVARSCCSAPPDPGNPAARLLLSARACRGADGDTAPLGALPCVRPADLRHEAHFVLLYAVFLPDAPTAGTDRTPPDKVPIPCA